MANAWPAQERNAALCFSGKMMMSKRQAETGMADDSAINGASEASGDVTHLLNRWGEGDRSVLEQLTPIIYKDLLRLARVRLSHEYRDHTLQPTALVHEAYVRLADQKKLHAGNRLHFYAIASNTMRRVLIEHARKRNAQKREGGLRITLEPGMSIAKERTPDVLVLDEALSQLAVIDARKSQAIELKFFGGLTTEEIASVLEISVATVGRELRLGQSWIRRAMSRQTSALQHEQ